MKCSRGVCASARASCFVRNKSWASRKATLQPNAIVRKRSKHTVSVELIQSSLLYFCESCHAQCTHTFASRIFMETDERKNESSTLKYIDCMWHRIISTFYLDRFVSSNLLFPSWKFGLVNVIIESLKQNLLPRNPFGSYQPYIVWLLVLLSSQKVFESLWVFFLLLLLLLLLLSIQSQFRWTFYALLSMLLLSMIWRILVSCTPQLLKLRHRGKRAKNNVD